MNTDHPLARNFIQHQRKSVTTYTCPLCESTYHNEAKTYDHGLRNHPEYLADLRLAEKAEEVKGSFCRQAIKKTQQKATVGPAAAETRLSPQSFFGSRKSSGRNIGDDDSRHRSPARRTSNPTGSQGPQKHIDDIGHLTLNQATSKDQKDQPVLINNPRKRGAESESVSTGLPIGGYKIGSMSTKVRHGKTLSGGMEVDLTTRQGFSPDDPEFSRGPSDTKQPLYDPKSDLVGLARKDRHGEYSGTGDRRHASTGFQNAAIAPALSEKENTYTHGRVGHGKHNVTPPQQKSKGQARQPFLSRMEQEEDGSGSPPEDDFLEKGPPDLLVDDPEMLLQPETRPISHEQLVVEVKGIYAGLVMVEAKCIDIDERQSAAAQERDPTKRPELKNDQWQSLIALHKQLLHEHHDFFLASQHPSASIALSKLAAKYSMPARMWRHGIHAFLEVLRHRLPESLEHMLAFIYIAYSMMALLYETVPAFEDTWIECLGDLGRYRMAIEDDEPRDREVWSNVARFWYNKASDNTPDVGRLYHHLAILARPYTLEQLSLYTRSLTCVVPFESARGSIMTLFNPVLNNKDTVQRRPFSLETLLIKAHAILFTRKHRESAELLSATFRELENEKSLENYIVKVGSKFKEIGAYVATSAIAGLFEYGHVNDGKTKPKLRLAFEDAQRVRDEAAKALPTRSENVPREASPGGPHGQVDSTATWDVNDGFSCLSHSSRLACSTLSICLSRPRDSNVYPLVHIYLGFLWSLIIVQQACKYFEQTEVLQIIEKDLPWISLCLFLNVLAEDPQVKVSTILGEDFPRPLKENGQPLPEDYVMRGQLYTRWYYPGYWFTAAMSDDDERSHDLPSMTHPRKERILWLGHRIASANRWIRFDKGKKCFSITDYVAKNIIGKSELGEIAREQDVVMSEALSATEDSPRTMSLAPSDSTRASTPTDLQDLDVLPPPLTPKATHQVSATDDVPMIDLSPGKYEQTNSLRKSKTPDQVSSPT